jgi:DeoR family fructose operon transcriptional repressor
MFSEERQQHILEMLNNKASIKVNELAEKFNVSESTIRRDLKQLHDSGVISRTHGGAVSNARTSFEPAFKDKIDEKHEEKVTIGKVAADMIKDGDTIILDSGTTTLEIAKNITAKNITVITNSIDIAGILSHKDNVEIIVTGGSLRLNTRAMVGHLTEMVLNNFRVDKAFVGANGVSIKEGITTPNFLEAHTKKTMIDSADKVIVVVDSSKFNNVSFSIICPIKNVSTIVTDINLEEEVAKDFEDEGIEVIRY